MDPGTSRHVRALGLELPRIAPRSARARPRREPPRTAPQESAGIVTDAGPWGGMQAPEGKRRNPSGERSQQSPPQRSRRTGPAHLRPLRPERVEERHECFRESLGLLLVWPVTAGFEPGEGGVLEERGHFGAVLDGDDPVAVPPEESHRRQLVGQFIHMIHELQLLAAPVYGGAHRAREREPSPGHGIDPAPVRDVLGTHLR